MTYLVVCTAALIASGLTLFSGFGLGTILLPTFALFFPLPVAIAMTAVVHLLNNIFKFVLLGRHADWPTLVRFGVPAMATSFLGAMLLVRLSDLAPLYIYEAFGRQFEVTPIGIAVAVLMLVFALIEIAPAFDSMSFNKKYIPLGGVLSGFFGGLSGHQGALRSAFLINCGLSKQGFVATGVTIACVVDITRISVYGSKYDFASLDSNLPVLVAAVVAAFVGAFVGNRLLHKVSMRTIRTIVSVMLIAIAVGLGIGVI